MPAVQSWATTVTAGASAVTGNAVSKLILRVIQHNWPWLLDNDTRDAIEVLTLAVIVPYCTRIAHKFVHEET